MVLVFVLFLHVNLFARFGTGDTVLHISERWEDHLYKASISYSDSSTAIDSNQHFAEWLVFNNHTCLIPFIWTSSRLVLYGDTCAHWDCTQLASVPLQSGPIRGQSSCQCAVPVLLSQTQFPTWLVLSWNNRHNKVGLLQCDNHLVDFYSIFASLKLSTLESEVLYSVSIIKISHASIHGSRLFHEILLKVLATMWPFFPFFT